MLNMKKLNLPIIRNKLPKAGSLAMDDYLKFVLFNLRYTIKNKKTLREWKKKSAVNVPFILK